MYKPLSVKYECKKLEILCKKRTQFHGPAYHKIAMATWVKATKANTNNHFLFLEVTEPVGPMGIAISTFQQSGVRAIKPSPTDPFIYLSCRVTKMLATVADLLPQMLPFKFLPFNDVTDVTAFPTSYINDACLPNF